MKITAYNDQIFPIYMEMKYEFQGKKKIHCREFRTPRLALLYYLDMCREYINVQLDEYERTAKDNKVIIADRWKEALTGRHAAPAYLLAYRLKNILHRLPDSHMQPEVRNFLRWKIHLVAETLHNLINTLKRLES